MSPPLVKGGQGRTSQSLRRDATAAFWPCLILALVIAILILRASIQ